MTNGKPEGPQVNRPEGLQFFAAFLGEESILGHSLRANELISYAIITIAFFL